MHATTVALAVFAVLGWIVFSVLFAVYLEGIYDLPNWITGVLTLILLILVPAVVFDVVSYYY